jgi:hypothetical protein
VPPLVQLCRKCPSPSYGIRVPLMAVARFVKDGNGSWPTINAHSYAKAAMLDLSDDEKDNAVHGRARRGILGYLSVPWIPSPCEVRAEHLTTSYLSPQRIRLVSKGMKHVVSIRLGSRLSSSRGSCLLFCPFCEKAVSRHSLALVMLSSTTRIPPTMGHPLC